MAEKSSKRKFTAILSIDGIGCLSIKIVSKPLWNKADKSDRYFNIQNSPFIWKMNKSGQPLPITVEQAVEWLISEYPVEEKARIANTGEWNLMDLYFSLSVDIEDKLYLRENKALVECCRATSGDEYFFYEEASYIIITSLWKRLQTLYKWNAIRQWTLNFRIY